MEAEKTKCLIIGSGPAGYTAAIYAARANLSPILYQGIVPGGQLTTTTEVENFPGFPTGVQPLDLMEDLRKQSERFGARVRGGAVTAIELKNGTPFRAVIDGTRQVLADTVIIATGATAKYLGLPSEAAYAGRGVSGCATCDGFFYKKKTVAVVGGGDTAAEDAIYLAGLAAKVYLVVRKNYLRASQVLQERVRATPNIEIIFEHNTREILGDESGVTGARLVGPDGVERTIALDGFFLAIGHHPNTELFAGQLELREDGYIKTWPDTTATSVPGVFAAGDVQDPDYRQAIVAAGSGCKAALDSERFLITQGAR